MNFTRRTVLAAAAMVALPVAALAHAPKVGHHGGPQTNAGPYHLEIVAKDKTLSVYLHDHGDKPVATTGFTGTAIFVIDGKSERIDLAPANAESLAGTASVALPEEPKGVVRLTAPGGSIVQGQFK
jgi:hypothetical protein